MPKFTEKEKEAIRNKLLDEGRRLFAVLGLKKTSIEDVTKAVGIAQGSFYLFYSSKEELYCEILQQEERVIRSQLIERFFAQDHITREMFKQFLRRSFAVMEENPFIRQIYDEDAMESVFRKLPEDKLQELFTDDSAFFVPLIVRGQQQGWMAARNPETIVSLIRSIVLLAMQKRQIGEERYEETIELLIELVASGLVKEEAQRHD
ncbi:TetR/AcrR family transcriptional regulator [Paenibacillus sp. MSJ-34]|uniref:TetR/AcrR family transcriptional regulator n=1 Tax=Paenibacillus sp. MSJ-34 TaxID=2841529 RepID=UPI001C11B8A0|nr:TetR/AcrR family transcriptional regulator [Paenibacillus sp. MSJ-34]MBU5444754.1 TetR/AcrR family transcriptional regulator [Paenibacillus sp. MSJ-34]